MYASTILVVSHVFVGMIEIILGMPLLLGKIKRNIFYGFRTPKTLSDDKIWEESNKKVGKDLIMAGVILTIASLLLFFVKDSISIETLLIICLILLFVPIIAVIIRGLSYLKTL